MNPLAPLTSIIGREDELAEVRQLMGQARLVTLTGVGGMAEPRLALAVRSSLTGGTSRPTPEPEYGIIVGSMPPPLLSSLMVVPYSETSQTTPLDKFTVTSHRMVPL